MLSVITALLSCHICTASLVRMLDAVWIHVFYLANLQTGELVVLQKALRHKHRNHCRGASSYAHLQKGSGKHQQVLCLTHTKAFPHSPETYQGPVPTAREQTHPASTSPAFSFLHLSRWDGQLDKTFSPVDPKSHLMLVGGSGLLVLPTKSNKLLHAGDN